MTQSNWNYIYRINFQRIKALPGLPVCILQDTKSSKPSKFRTVLSTSWSSKYNGSRKVYTNEVLKPTFLLTGQWREWQGSQGQGRHSVWHRTRPAYRASQWTRKINVVCLFAEGPAASYKLLRFFSLFIIKFIIIYIHLFSFFVHFLLGSVRQVNRHRASL